MILLILVLAVSAFLGSDPAEQTVGKGGDAGTGIIEKISSLLTSPQKPEWLAWSVPLVKCVGRVGCWKDDGSILHLGKGDRGLSIEGGTSTSTERRLQILVRLGSGAIDDMKLVSSDCTIITKGSNVQWLEDVSTDSSIRFFAKIIDGTFTKVKSIDVDHAISAIALHDDPRADGVLEQLTGPKVKLENRKQAAFWLGMARGKRGLEVLKRLVATDDNPDFRVELTSALASSDAPEAVDELITMARKDPSGEVRGQALFWLALKAGKKATDAVLGALDNDPDLEVRKQALFALSEMSDGNGIPILIKVAEGKSHLELRESAFFWLGQSKDPRALDYIEKVLTR